MTLKLTALGTAASLAAFLSVGTVNAADMPAPKVMPVEAKAPDPLIGFSFGSRYQTDYNFRGVSQSNRDGSYQSFFEAQYFGGFAYTGFATYQTRLPTKPDMEFDLTAGIRPTYDKFALDLGVIYYFYPNEQRLFGPNGFGRFNVPLTTANTDFLEYAAKGTWTATDSLTLGLNVFYSPNYLGQHANGTYTSGTAAYTLPATWFSFLPEAYSGGFSISSELGYYFLGAAKTSATLQTAFNLPSYLYGNVGLSYTYKNIVLDVRYHNTDLSKQECFALTGDFRGFVNGGTSRWCGDAVIGSITFQTSTAAPGIYAEPGGLMNLFR
ncbi:TorF family putative porin [Methylobacterium sp. 77]|uniref:TorF family putative porin n=1 Tax=Methylobacterium sp. 77 TaxID=1101192 RepID=UPI001FD9CAA3|nr:TorF family putative porin [Methylobacterium sp. 77]